MWETDPFRMWCCKIASLLLHYLNEPNRHKQPIQTCQRIPVMCPLDTLDALVFSCTIPFEPLMLLQIKQQPKRPSC
jgi:hypothetical protein